MGSQLIFFRPRNKDLDVWTHRSWSEIWSFDCVVQLGVSSGKLESLPWIQLPRVWHVWLRSATSWSFGKLEAYLEFSCYLIQLLFLCFAKAIGGNIIENHHLQLAMNLVPRYRVDISLITGHKNFMEPLLVSIADHILMGEAWMMIIIIIYNYIPQTSDSYFVVDQYRLPYTSCHVSIMDINPWHTNKINIL